MIVDHRYSKQSKILESTVQLRASSTNLGGMLNTDSQVIDRRSMQKFHQINESHNNGIIDERRKRDNRSSQDLTGNRKERILNSFELTKKHKLSVSNDSGEQSNKSARVSGGLQKVADKKQEPNSKEIEEKSLSSN